VILSIEPRPFKELRYLNASRRGRAEVARLPFFHGRAELPRSWDALVVASDLQGIATWGEAAALLGVSVAREIDAMDLGRVVIVLAGDLYSVPEANKRGGFGDVSSVWDAFAEIGEVVGVAGNHDDVSRVSRGTLLDGDVVEMDGVRIGGVGLVIGNDDDDKPGRRGTDDQLERLYDAMPCDVLVLHEGPRLDDDRDGAEVVRDALEEAHVKLVVCGHRPWVEPLARMGRATQILNVHERVVVLQKQ